MTEFIFALLAMLLPAPDADSSDMTQRKAGLYAMVDQAVTNSRARTRRDEIDPIIPARTNSSADEIAVELAHMELASGFLQKTCIYDTQTVREMRVLLAYADLLKSWDYSENEINKALLERAGEHRDQLERMLKFMSIDSMRYLICEDYIMERLADGMKPDELRKYIDEIPTEQVASNTTEQY